MVLINEHKRERLEDAHILNSRTHILDAAAQDGRHLIEETVLRSLYPVLHHTAIQFLIVIVVGANLSRIGNHQYVQVRHDGICIRRKLRYHLAQSALNLVDGLLACFHNAIFRCVQRLRP